jgi:hypothetical protein
MNILDGDTGGLVERLDVDAAAIALKEVYPDIASTFALRATADKSLIRATLAFLVSCGTMCDVRTSRR